MALAHLAVRPHSRAKGQSAAAAIAYRAGARLRNSRTGEIHDYRSRRCGAVRDTIHATPPDLSLTWNPKDLQSWADIIEAAERRKNSTVLRDIEVSLPHELDECERLALAQDWADWLSTRYRTPVLVSLHAAPTHGDQRNEHMHCILPTRVLDPDGSFGAKLRELDDWKTGRQAILEMRTEFETLANQALAKSGQDARVDMVRKRPPYTPKKIHMGPIATAIARSGRPSLSLADAEPHPGPANETTSDIRITDPAEQLAADYPTDLHPPPRQPRRHSLRIDSLLDFAEIAKLLRMILAIPFPLLAPQKPLRKPRPPTPPPDPSLIQALLRWLLGAPPLAPPENSPRYDRRGFPYSTLPNALPTKPPEPPATPQERKRPLAARPVLLPSNPDPALTDGLSSPPSATPQSGTHRHRRAPVVPPAIAEIEVSAPLKPPRRRRIPKPTLLSENLQAAQARVAKEALGSPPSATPSPGTRRHRRAPVVPPAIAEIEVSAPLKPPRRRRRRIPKPTLLSENLQAAQARVAKEALGSPPSATPSPGTRRHRRAPVVPPAIAEIEVSAPLKPPRRRRIPKPTLLSENLQAAQARVAKEALSSPPSATPSPGTRRHRRAPVVPPAIAEIEVSAPLKPPRRRRIPKPTLLSENLQAAQARVAKEALGSPPSATPSPGTRRHRRAPVVPPAIAEIEVSAPLKSPRRRRRRIPKPTLLSENLQAAQARVAKEALGSPPSATPSPGTRRHRRAPVVPPAIAEIEVSAPLKPPRRRRRRIPKPTLLSENLQAAQARVAKEALGSPPSATPSPGTRRHRRAPVVPPAIAEIEVSAPLKPPRRRRRRIPKPTLLSENLQAAQARVAKSENNLRTAQAALAPKASQLTRPRPPPPTAIPETIIPSTPDALHEVLHAHLPTMGAEYLTRPPMGDYFRTPIPGLSRKNRNRLHALDCAEITLGNILYRRDDLFSPPTSMRPSAAHEFRVDRWHTWLADHPDRRTHLADEMLASVWPDYQRDHDLKPAPIPPTPAALRRVLNGHLRRLGGEIVQALAQGDDLDTSIPGLGPKALQCVIHTLREQIPDHTAFAPPPHIRRSGTRHKYRDLRWSEWLDSLPNRRGYLAALLTKAIWPIHQRDHGLDPALHAPEPPPPAPTQPAPTPQRPSWRR